MRFSVLTLFPGMFEGPLSESLLGKAIADGRIEVECVDPRGFTTDRHRSADDEPYGGGEGMVMKPEPLVACIEHVREARAVEEVWLLSPQGRPLTQALARELAQRESLALVCGRYEGFDERVRNFVDGEVSIGDYVLSGGEPAAWVVIDALARLVPGVLGNARSLDRESFDSGLLEYPQYTRPREFRGLRVPEVLLSGDHGRIERWRRRQALTRTKARRPDLFDRLTLSEEDRALLDAAGPGGEP